MCSFISAYYLYKDRFSEQFANAFLHFGQANYPQFFNVNLRKICQNNREYFLIMLDILRILGASGMGFKAYIDSHAIYDTIELSLSILGEHISDSNVHEKQLCMSFLIDVWYIRHEVIEGLHNPDKNYTIQVLNCLKAGCRNSYSIVLRMICINGLFALLILFAKKEIKSAPKIYKTLTYLLIENYTNIELRDELIKNFVWMFKKWPKIPLQILCEPFLKQIKLNYDRDVETSAKDNKSFVLQPNSILQTFNTNDIELLVTVATHPKLKVELAC